MTNRRSTSLRRLSLAALMLVAAQPALQAQTGAASADCIQPVVTRVAGTGDAASYGDGGPATAAALNGPNGVDADAAGNIYVGEFSANRVRKIAPDGTITTVAGTGAAGYSGDGGPAVLARLDGPFDAVPDGSGNLYISEHRGNRIRKVDANGVITTIAGRPDVHLPQGNAPRTFEAWIHPDSYQFGTVFNYGVFQVNRRSGLLYIYGRLFMVGENNDVSGNIFMPTGTWAHVAISYDGAIARLYVNGVLDVAKPLPNGPLQTTGDNWRIGNGSGINFMREPFAGRIDKVRVWSTARTQAQINADMTSADCSSEQGLVASYDFNQGTAGALNPGAMSLPDCSPNGAHGALRNFALSGPSSNWVEGVPDTAGGPPSNALRFDGYDDFVEGTNPPGIGDGGPATHATLAAPREIAVDAAGNLYFSDAGHNRVRKIDTNGIITTVAFASAPGGVTLDRSGNLYFSDTWAYRIRKIDANGNDTVVAGNGQGGYSGDGGPATEASLNAQNGIAFDSAGNLYICDAFNARIRRVDTAGIITTVAGNGTFGSPVDGGPALDSPMSGIPGSLCVDPDDNVIYTESYIVRRVDVDTDAYTFGGFQQPINSDGSSVFQLNSTVPVKFWLRDRTCAPATGASPHLFVARVSDGVSGTQQEAVSSSAADSGNTFRHIGDGNYVFNMGTRTMSQGTWDLRVDLGDGTSRTVRISLRSR